MRDARLVLPGVRAALEERAPAGHGHVLGDVADLIPALENKAPLAHGHTLADLPVAASGENEADKLVRADDPRLSDARPPTAHGHALADLPVAAAGESDAGKLVRADDPRLSGGGGSGGGFRNAVINGCCRVSHRAAKSLSGGWQVAQVDLLAVRADGGPTAGTIKKATGVTSLTESGYACLVQGATLGAGGAVWWRHRVEARDAARLRNGPAVLSARAYHDTGAAISVTLTVNKANAADDFSAVTPVASGTVTVANAADVDLTLAIPDLGECSNGLEILIKAACGAASNKWFYLGDLQLAPGTVATPFDLRPIAVETALVHRFLRPCVGLVGKADSATTLQIPLAHPGMRAVPGYEVTAPLAFTDAVTADVTQSQASVTTIHERMSDAGRISCGFFAGLTPGAVLIQRGAGGVLLASAEL